MHLLKLRFYGFFIGWMMICICFLPATYATELISISGNISDINFDTLVKYYHVTADIEVPADKSVKIPAGITLLFESDVIFHINGQCDIEGNELNPVILTSVNDTEIPSALGANPSQWDWKGVVIGKNAKVSFCNVNIKFAESPIEADSACMDITLKRVFRFQTGNPVFALNGKQLKVKSDEPFSYQSPGISEKYSIVQQTASPVTPVVPTMSTVKKNVPWYKRGSVRWTLGGSGALAALFAGGSIVGYYYYDNQYDEKMKSYSDMTNKNFDQRRNAKKKADKAFDNKNILKPSAIAGGITAAVLLAGLGLTFYF